MAKYPMHFETPAGAGGKLLEAIKSFSPDIVAVHLAFVLGDLYFHSNADGSWSFDPSMVSELALQSIRKDLADLVANMEHKL